MHKKEILLIKIYQARKLRYKWIATAQRHKEFLIKIKKIKIY